MNRIWRWDQGRLVYFQFHNLKSIAKCFVDIEGVQINQKDLDPLRIVLESETGMPFSPQDYKVWRNYKRVFECSMLATSIDNRLFVSDICKNLASDVPIDADEYLSILMPRFRYPYPAFSEYNSSEAICFPFCAILKYLIANFEKNAVSSLTLEEVFSKIIGNNCSGKETLDFYRHLPDTNRQSIGDENRQVREMLIFMSQLSILKWYNGRLLLDVTQSDLNAYNNFTALSTPFELKPDNSREQDFINLTSIKQSIIQPISLQSRESTIEDVFTEGKRVRVTHVKIERSPLLRKLFFERYPTTVCHMCGIDYRVKYPWTDNLLEIHHILPLASSLSITSKGTTLEDILPLCPNCHRSVHSYYKIWLNGNSLIDFKDKKEALSVYNEAKYKIAI